MTGQHGPRLHGQPIRGGDRRRGGQEQDREQPERGKESPDLADRVALERRQEHGDSEVMMRRGRSKDAEHPPKVARRSVRGRSVGRYRTMKWSRDHRRACRPPESAVPQIRPFRALRFDPSAAGDLADVIAPAGESLDAADRERLVARHVNVVRVDSPVEQADDEPDDRFRRAARSLAEWRSGAILRKDAHASIYGYERTGPEADGPPSRQVGYFARLHLEALGSDAGVEPAAGGSAPVAIDERYRLMRATGLNSRPVIATYDDPDRGAGARLTDAMSRTPDTDVCDATGVRHRLWVIPADDAVAADVPAILSPAAAGPISLVAGRATYDGAIRYRDERRMSRSCEEDPPFDYVLALLLARSDAPTAPSAAIGLVLDPHEW